jgi:hypothetical protein
MKTPIRIVFDAYHLYHLPQFDPVIDKMIQDDRFEVFLTTSPETEPQEYNLTKKILKARNCPLIQADDELQRAQKIKALAPAVFICGWSRYAIQEMVPDSTLVGMIYHGIGVKPSYWRDNNSRLNVRFVEGPFRMQQLRDKNIQTDLELVGFPKIDPLFNGQIGSQQELLQDLGLDPQRKTILYAPTFYPSSFESFGLKLPAMLQNEYNLIIKLHQWSYFMKKFSGANLRGHVKLAAQIRKKYPQVVIIEPKHYNIIDLYRAADVLLTEASSTIYEFMALGKQVIVCDFYKKKWGHHILPNRIFRHRLDQEMYSNMTDFCFHIQKPQDLPQALAGCFNESDPFVEIRKNYISEMLYQLDGQASQRICTAIPNLLK